MLYYSLVQKQKKMKGNDKQNSDECLYVYFCYVFRPNIESLKVYDCFKNELKTIKRIDFSNSKNTWTVCFYKMKTNVDVCKLYKKRSTKEGENIALIENWTRVSKTFKPTLIATKDYEHSPLYGTKGCEHFPLYSYINRNYITFNDQVYCEERYF